MKSVEHLFSHNINQYNEVQSCNGPIETSKA